MNVKLFTILELSEILRCSRQNAYSLVEKNIIPSIRVGATGSGIRVSETAIQEFLERKRIGRDPQPPPEKENPRSKGNLFVMLDSERLREAWRQRDVDAR